MFCKLIAFCTVHISDVTIFLFIVFNVYSFKDDPSLMYKFNSEMNNKTELSLTGDDIDKTRHSSTCSSVISSLPCDSDVVLEDIFEMLAQLAPEALICASLTKRYGMIRCTYSWYWQSPKSEFYTVLTKYQNGIKSVQAYRIFGLTLTKYILLPCSLTMSPDPHDIIQ